MAASSMRPVARKRVARAARLRGRYYLTACCAVAQLLRPTRKTCAIISENFPARRSIKAERLGRPAAAMEEERAFV